MVILGLALAALGIWRGGWWALAAVAGGGALAASIRREGPSFPLGTSRATPHLLPDPALEWLRLAHDALGTWAIEGGTPGLAGYLSLNPGAGFTEPRLRLIEQRLLEMRDRDGGGGERLEEGTLVFEALSGFVAGLMLRPGHTPKDLETAHIDLRYLLDGLTRRPIIHELAQGQAPPIEESRSVALRLAYQIERVAGVSVVVALLEPAGARIAAVSGTADQRLVGTMLGSETPFVRVAQGTARSMQVRGRALTELVSNRRNEESSQVTMLHLQDQGEAIGAVAFWRTPPGPLPAAALAELEEILHQAEPRFRAAMEMEKIDHSARNDHLTGLPNRNTLEEHMGRVGQSDGAVIMADLDRFQELNDTLGHPAGDAALVHFARVLNREVRGDDVAARIGGQEFAVWLPGTNLASALRVAERIRASLATTAWDWQGRPWSLSASFGVADCPETTRSVQNLMSRADAALYQAKNAGRDRVAEASASR